MVSGEAPHAEGASDSEHVRLAPGGHQIINCNAVLNTARGGGTGVGFAF